MNDTQQFLDLLFSDGGKHEVRVLDYGSDERTLSGIYDAPEVEGDLTKLTPDYRGVYVSLNPVHLDPIALRKVRKGEAVKDTQITRRTHLLLDVDSPRANGFKGDMATEEEREEARRACAVLSNDLAILGWPEPITVDSGNGFQLVYRIDLPVDDGGLVKRVLRGLRAKYLGVDVKNSNAARITRLPGTLNRKGRELPDRPYRTARLVSAPGEMKAVTREQLEAIAEKVESPSAPPAPAKLADDAAWPDMEERAQRAAAYVAKLEPAISGGGGHSATIRAARAIRVDFAVDEEHGWPILVKYNSRCQPPWDAGELRHKWDDAEVGDKPRGCMYAAGPLRNYYAEEREKVTKKGATTETIYTPRPVADITRDILARTGGWPKQVNGDLFAVDDSGSPQYLKNATQLMAWLDRQTRLEWKDYGTGGIKLPSAWTVFEDLRTATEGYEAVEVVPHEPALPGIYYLPHPIAGGDGETLASLLRRFNPASDVDRDLLKSAFLTALWGGQAGQRPAFLLTAPEDDPRQGRGVGKTTLAQTIGDLVGGALSFRPRGDWSDVEKRLLSPAARNKRVAMLDNVKTYRFSWDDLEAAVTAAVISGRRLYEGEGRRPNLMTWFITINGADLSQDLAQRVIIVQLKRPQHTGDWENDTRHLIAENRWAIVGDILAELRRPLPPVRTSSRWGAWEAGVLARSTDDLEACQQVIAARQEEVDDDRTEMLLVRETVIALLKSRKVDPDRETYRLDASDIQAIMCEARGESVKKNSACKAFYRLGIPEVIRRRSHGSRLTEWVASQGREMVEET